MTAIIVNPASVAPPVGAYSHGVVAPATGRWLHVSGQIGMLPDGTLATDFTGQARAAWANLVAILRAADMDAQNLVKVTTFMTDAGDLAALNPVRYEFLGNARPASTLVIVKSLARAAWLVEIEAVAHGD